MSSPAHRRMVYTDEVETLSGRPLLWAYGRRTVAKLAGCSQYAVRHAVRRGQLDMGDLLAVAAWIQRMRERAARRGRR